MADVAASAAARRASRRRSAARTIVALAKEWQQAVDADSGYTYYINNRTGESSWSEPPEVEAVRQLKERKAQRTRSASLGACTWARTLDPSTGQFYYYDRRTKDTVWEAPPGVLFDDAGRGRFEPEADRDGDGDAMAGSTGGLQSVSEDVATGSSASGSGPGGGGGGVGGGGSGGGGKGRARRPSSLRLTKTGEVEVTTAWVEGTDPGTGYVYYFNTETQESSWDKPEELLRVEALQARLEAAQSKTIWDEGVGESASAAKRPKWKSATDKDGRVYYYNRESRETSWEKPADFDGQLASDGSKLPDGWTKTVHAASGREYYYNRKTKETSWQMPVAPDGDSGTDGLPNRRGRASTIAGDTPGAAEGATPQGRARSSTVGTPVGAVARHSEAIEFAFLAESELPPPPPFNNVPKVYRSVCASDVVSSQPRFRLQTDVTEIKTALRSKRTTQSIAAPLVVRQDARSGKRGFNKKHCMLHDRALLVYKNSAAAVSGALEDSITVYGAQLYRSNAQKLQVDVVPRIANRVVSIQFRDKTTMEEWVSAVHSAGAKLRDGNLDKA